MRFASSKAELPVATNCTSGRLSVISFSFRPMSAIRWASSMMTFRLLPMMLCSRVEVAFSNNARTSGSSPFSQSVSSELPNSVRRSVVLPTCLAPSNTMAFPEYSFVLIFSSKNRSIIIFKEKFPKNTTFWELIP